MRDQLGFAVSQYLALGISRKREPGKSSRGNTDEGEPSHGRGHRFPSFQVFFSTLFGESVLRSSVPRWLRFGT